MDYQLHQILLSYSHCDGFCIEYFSFASKFESIMVAIMFCGFGWGLSFGMPDEISC